jgi:hypothetical protein
MAVAVTAGILQFPQPVFGKLAQSVNSVRMTVDSQRYLQQRSGY